MTISIGADTYASLDEAIDASNDGDVIHISESVTSDAIEIGHSVTIEGEAGVTVSFGNVARAITLNGDAGDTIAFENLTLQGEGTRIGIVLPDGESLGGLTLTGVQLQGFVDYGIATYPLGTSAGSFQTLTITDSTFADNGTANIENGASHLSIRGLTGTATLNGVTFDGASDDPATTGTNPEYAVQFTGLLNGLLGSEESPDATIDLTDVTISGAFGKNALAFFNYDDLDLSMDNVDLSGAATGWGPVLNLDGIVGDIHGGDWTVALPAGAIAAELQGDEAAQAGPHGSDLGQAITGTDADDRLSGVGGADTLTGGEGDDVLDGGSGDDRIDGGEGDDVAAFTGQRSDYEISRNGDGSFTVEGDDGADTLRGVEHLDFAADTVLYDIGADAPDFSDGRVRFSQSFDDGFDGFRTEAGDWAGAITLVPNDTDGIVTPDGSGFAIFSQSSVATVEEGRETGPTTRFDGHRLDGGEGIRVEAQIYLDPDWGDGEGFDLSVAANRSTADLHLQDFVLHVAKDASTQKLLVGGSTGSTGEPRQDLEAQNHGEVSAAGWYRFQYDMYPVDGAHEVTMSIFDQDDVLIFSQTVTNASAEFGGNRYLWFTSIDVDGGVAVNDVSLTTLDDDPIQEFDATTPHLIVGSYPDLATAVAGVAAGNTLRVAEGSYAGEGVITVAHGDFTIDAPAGATGIQLALGAGVADLAVAGEADISIAGNTTPNAITGNAGDNLLTGGGDADTLDGGAGRDTASYVGSPDGVTISLAVGGAQGGAGDASGDVLIGIENLIGSGGADSLVGDAAANELAGSGGDDTLAGGAGGDLLDGGAGNDLLRGTIADLAGDTILGFGDGDDLVFVEIGDADSVVRNALAAALDGTDLVAGGNLVPFPDAGGSFSIDAAGDMTIGAEVTTMNGVGGVLIQQIAAPEGPPPTSPPESPPPGDPGEPTSPPPASPPADPPVPGGTPAEIGSWQDLANVTPEDGIQHVVTTDSVALPAFIPNLTMEGDGDLNAEGNDLSNVMEGNGGSNILVTYGGDDSVTGGEGNDFVAAGQGNDSIWLDSEDGEPGDDIAWGGQGDDYVDGGGGDDIVNGDRGNDLVEGGDGSDLVNGGQGDDLVSGGEGADTAHGGQGDDGVAGGTGDDLLTGDVGDDLVEGGEGADMVEGGQGADTVAGGEGDDTAYGGQGADVVSGGAGDDVLSGDRGDDTLAGGEGADAFAFGAESGTDHIADFAPGEDRIEIDLDEDGTINGVAIGSFADLLDRIVDTADGAFLDLGGGHAVLLDGVTKDQLDQSDFQLV